MNPPLDEKKRLLALAYLKTGKKPKLVEDITGVKYSTVLKLSKELAKAESNGLLGELFGLDAAALEDLLSAVAAGSEGVKAGVLLGRSEDINTVSRSVAKQAKSQPEELQGELQTTALQLNRAIRTSAIGCTDVGALATLVSALAELQSTFFDSKTNNIQINNMGANEGFEKMLGD